MSAYPAALPWHRREDTWAILIALALVFLVTALFFLGGAGFVSAGLAIYFLNWLFRIGADGDRERDTEQAARDYFNEHGRWPS